MGGTVVLLLVLGVLFLQWYPKTKMYEQRLVNKINYHNRKCNEFDAECGELKRHPPEFLDHMEALDIKYRKVAAKAKYHQSRAQYYCDIANARVEKGLDFGLRPDTKHIK
jgi:hypothetical protein